MLVTFWVKRFVYQTCARAFCLLHEIFSFRPRVWNQLNIVTVGRITCTVTCLHSGDSDDSRCQHLFWPTKREHTNIHRTHAHTRTGSRLHAGKRELKDFWSVLWRVASTRQKLCRWSFTALTSAIRQRDGICTIAGLNYLYRSSSDRCVFDLSVTSLLDIHVASIRPEAVSITKAYIQTRITLEKSLHATLTWIANCSRGWTHTYLYWLFRYPHFIWNVDCGPKKITVTF